MIRLFSNFPEEDQENWPTFQSLAPIYERRFGGKDPERFRIIWCTIATLCGIDPLLLNENDVLIELCPNPSRWSNVNERTDDIEEFALRYSGQKPVPEDLRTIGAMVDWLL